MNKEFSKVLAYFKTLTTIPRGSENREGIRDYLCSFAKEHGLTYRTDSADNVVIRKPASPAYADKAPVILQGHTDMVCALAEGYTFDFLHESLHLEQHGDSLSAQGTTLGGDDGIAVAMMLALLESESELPALECIFTSDEEIGMIGADALDMSDIRGKYLINIDSEDEGVLTVSCAGGSTAVAHIPYTSEAVSGYAYEICIGGLTGGHSGTEIIKGGYNACKLLARVLEKLENYRLVSIGGGEKENAIAVAAKMRVVLPAPFDFAPLLAAIENACKGKEPAIVCGSTALGESEWQAMTSESTRAVANALTAFPQGIVKMSAFDESAVQTSLNLGVLEQTDTEIVFTFCVRSSVTADREALEEQLRRITAQNGGTLVLSGIYPGWEYKEDSVLRERAVQVYEKLYGTTPKIEAIHAGLECGVLLSKKPTLDCISLGPQMYDVHTPRERLSISSAERTWAYLLALIKAL